MADVFSKAKRSEVMSRIRSRGNQATEVVLARLLRAHGITGWRRHLQLKIKNSKLKIPKPTPRLQTPDPRPFLVRPDFVFPRRKLAVFVDGCFWHGCPRHGTQPQGNRAFWRKKFATNRARDRRVNRALRATGWRVLRIWECTLKKRPFKCVERIRKNF
jgi:DNA mismatch endonuclease (patch repair protein)